MTDTNYLYEYFLTHSPESDGSPAAVQQNANEDDDEE